MKKYIFLDMGSVITSLEYQYKIDLLKQKDNFIHTDTYKGLTVEDAENAIKILNNK